MQVSGSFIQDVCSQIQWCGIMFGFLSTGDERSSEPLEAGSPAGSGSVVSLCHLPALLHPLRADVRP